MPFKKSTEKEKKGERVRVRRREKGRGKGVVKFYTIIPFPKE